MERTLIIFFIYFFLKIFDIFGVNKLAKKKRLTNQGLIWLSLIDKKISMEFSNEIKK